MLVEKIVSGRLRNNTYIVSNDNNECILVDASCDLSEIENRVKSKKILGVFLTHGHYDHFVNIEGILKKYDTKCFLYKTEIEKLKNPKANYSIVFNKIVALRVDPARFVLLEDRESIKLSDFDIKIFLTRGHTDGSICIDFNGEALFTGDTLFKNSYGRTDLISGSEEDMKQSLMMLKENFFGRKIYPGHGDTSIVWFFVLSIENLVRINFNN